MKQSIKSLMFVGGLLMGVYALSPAFLKAQDLKAELDALDDLPEDDLGGFGPSEDFSSVPDADNFSFGVSNPAPPRSQGNLQGTGSRELGVGDLDLRGLEQELNFDSFKDGGKVGLDQLRARAEPAFADDVGGRLTSLDFRQLSDRVRLVVGADKPIDWTRELRSQRRQVIVELRNMTIARETLTRALDTGEFEGPVALIRAFPSKVGGRDSVKILFQLRSFVDPTILRTGNELVIDFPIAGGDTLFRSRSASTVIVPKTYISANDYREFIGSPISLNVKNAELGDVLNLISRSSGKNFVVSGGVGEKKITISLNNVPWDQALALTLFNNGLGFQDLDTVYRVATAEELSADLDKAKEAALKTRSIIPVETRLISVSYATASEMTANLEKFLSEERGSITVDARTNTLVVTDIPEVLEKVDRYVRSVDRQTPQVLIEARIVEASEDFGRNRNFAWSLGQLNPDSDRSGALNVGSVPNLSEEGADQVGNSLMQLRFANLGGINLVDAFLRMSESQRLSRTIASPRVTVLANEEATISQGRKITVQRTTEAGIAEEFLDVVTELKVTPQVTADGFVVLTVDVKRDTPEGDDVGSRSAQTKMIVESGKTAVIGGLYTLENTDTERGFPFLRNIPIFGALFKNEVAKSRASNELLMFISPRIINADRSQVLGGAGFGEGDFTSSIVTEGAAGAR
jgi:type IV pilus assembly protein PilQ